MRLALAILLSLATGTTASAATYGLSIDRGINRGFRVARTMGIKPRCGPVAVRWTTRDESVAVPGSDAMFFPDTCTVAFNIDQRDELRDRTNASRVCAATVHELGHAAGLEHSENFRSVMHSPAALPRGCTRHGEWTWYFGDYSPSWLADY